MVIRGNSRGNPAQASAYLLKMGDNEAIRILDVNGQYDADEKTFHEAVFSMGLTSELSKSDKGLYHAQINPAPGEDKEMDDASWRQAADILAIQLGLEDQRRAIVLHTKKGRTHAHVVWERYDHEKEKMVSDSFSRLAQDRARKEMEETFKQKPTPHRNKHRPELKAHLSALWEGTSTGAAFIKAAKDNGYLISEGTGRNPFMVVDDFARSHNLPRQLKGVRLNEVRQRLRGEKLLTEKQAIIEARVNSENAGQKDKGKEQGSNQSRFKKAASGFAQSKQELLEKPVPKPDQNKKFQTVLDGFTGNKQPLTKHKSVPSHDDKGNSKAIDKVNDKTRAEKAASMFKATKDEILKQERSDAAKQSVPETFQSNKEPAPDPRREAFRKRMQEMDEEKQRNKDKGMEMD